MGNLLFEDAGADEFQGLDLKTLHIDQAWLRINSKLNQSAWLYARSDDCHRCAFKLLANVKPESVNNSLVFESKYGWTLQLRNDNSTPTVSDQSDNNVLCQVYAPMGQFGVYDVGVSMENSSTRCTFSTAKEPVDIYMPLLACFLFYVVAAVVWFAIKFSYRRGLFNSCIKWFKLTKDEDGAGQNNNSERGGGGGEGQLANKNTDKKKKSTRLKSLDTFRGISIVVMIFVNDGAGGYAFMEHATWNGLGVADLVFPWFMFIMGVAVPISLKSSYRREETKSAIFANILRRSCILFLLGLINNTLGGYNDLYRLRIPGVLQRFAISYFVVGIIALLFTPRELALPPSSVSNKTRLALHDVLVLWPQWIVHLTLVALHCFITFFLPVTSDTIGEECPTGYLGPAGLHLDGQHPSVCVGGAAGYIDRLFLSTQHIYNWPTARAVYNSGPYDPEGILGTLLCIFQVFLGLQAGTTVLLYSEWKSRAIRWLSWSVLTGGLGALLCCASKEDGWIPVNKNLWSLSFVMVTSCFAFFLLSICLVLIDVLKWWNGAPFLHPGMNSILMYLGHQVTYNLFPWHYQIGSGSMNTHFQRLVENLWGVTLWIIISTWLFYKKIFFTI